MNTPNGLPFLSRLLLPVIRPAVRQALAEERATPAGRKTGRGRHPAFYYDEPVRAEIERFYGQGTIDDCVAHLVARFGPERTPSRSAVHRYWQALDKQQPQTTEAA